VLGYSFNLSATTVFLTHEGENKIQVIFLSEGCLLLDLNKQKQQEYFGCQEDSNSSDLSKEIMSGSVMLLICHNYKIKENGCKAHVPWEGHSLLNVWDSLCG